MSAKWLTLAVASTFAGFLLGISATAQEASPVREATYPVLLSGPSPVRNSPPSVHTPEHPREIPLYRPPFRPRAGNIADPVLQTSTSTPAAAQAVGQWEGLGENYPGFTVTAVPPDPNMAVGPNHIVQWVNNAFVIFDKQGNQLQAPVSDSTFWGSLSTCYQGGGYSDPIIQYDRAADRWLVGEVAIPLLPPLIGQYAQCFAVSKTSDPTYTSDANGNNTSYYIWAYGFGSNVNDYDKIAVWSDGYYVTWNLFQNGSTFTGAEACGWNRDDMLAGVAAPRFKCFQLSSAYASLLPSELDGATAPPAGSPNFFMDIDPSSGALNLWKFSFDPATPTNSTFTGPTSISGVAPFTAPCANTQDCIPQPGTTQSLDALGDRLMYRLAYRNFGDHESIVANHTVLNPVGGNTGVRWYEVRSPNGTPTLYQQGTFAPDSDNRWMGSIAMDQSGNIGVGYSVASAATYPSIRYTGWEVGNTLGQLQAETSLVAGGGSQTGYNRWGDYSAMRTDPSDDCTFWYTQEYQATTQSANWNTRIGSFKFSSCGQPVAQAPTITTISPTSTTAGGAAFNLTVNGTGFVANSVVNFGGNARVTTFVSATQLTAAILASDIAAAGSVNVTVSNPGGGTSNAVSFTVNNPVPTITSISPTSATAGGAGFNLTVNGTGFVANSVVNFGGNARTTTFVSATQLTAAILASDIATAGNVNVTVTNPSPGGGNSNSASFTVNKANTTTSLSSSRNPSKLGQPVTFTATVSPSAATGTVTFYDGTNQLGSANLSAGKASLSTSKLSVGTHSITATYAGNSSYNGSSAVLYQTVGSKK